LLKSKTNVSLYLNQWLCINDDKNSVIMAFNISEVFQKTIEKYVGEDIKIYLLNPERHKLTSKYLEEENQLILSLNKKKTIAIKKWSYTRPL
jgi:hypothetical protein